MSSRSRWVNQKKKDMTEREHSVSISNQNSTAGKGNMLSYTQEFKKSIILMWNQTADSPNVNVSAKIRSIIKAGLTSYLICNDSNRNISVL